MFIDTHCHLNLILKDSFDTPLINQHLNQASLIIEEAAQKQVNTIINIGTSVIESNNCIILAQKFSSCYAAIGLHPNDCLSTWRNDLAQIKNFYQTKSPTKLSA